jgi:hypothetical protein
MSEDTVAEFGKNVLMKRPGQPAELTAAYVMLADPFSSYVSGATIAVTGGKPISVEVPRAPTFSLWAVSFWSYLMALPTVSAMSAPRAPSGLFPGMVESRAVWCSISELS